MDNWTAAARPADGPPQAHAAEDPENASTARLAPKIGPPADRPDPIRSAANRGRTRRVNRAFGVLATPPKRARRADGSYQRTVRIPGTGIRNTSRIGSPRQPQSAMLGAVGVGVGFMLGRLLFWPLLIIGILLLIFA
jgi:hypothetical protein